jgi:outer membrane protein TolC
MNHLRNYTKVALSLLIIGICFQFGCQPQQPFYLTKKGDWQKSYIGKATKIDYPNVDIHSLAEVCNTEEPLHLYNPDPKAMWKLTLEEAVQMALKNSKVIRTLNGVNFSQGGVFGVPGSLLQGGGNRTVYDPALIESDPTYGQEAALAAFDAQLTASTAWSKNYGRNGDDYNSTDGVRFDVGITKTAATGTQFRIMHANQYNYSYDASYNPTYRNSSWTSGFELGFRHPLLRGGGIEFNRIAGPDSYRPGQYNGVAIARLRTDMDLTDFEMSTRNLVADVERAYWNLYYAYHRLNSVRSGRDAAYQTWRQTKTHAEFGSAQGSAHQLAQAEQNYFQFRQQTEAAQDNLFRAEKMLRYIMGLTVSDGRLIRPIDDPITAPIRLDWQNIMCEALFRSPELRKQKWIIKQRELELKGSKNFMLPQLDLSGSHSIGSSAGAEKLLGAHDSAYGLLTGNGWTLGLDAMIPLGWRRELAGVRNAELNLTKSIAILHEQELELTHQLGASVQEISSAYQQMQSTYSTYRSATAEVTAVQNAYDAQKATLDLVLQAQRRRAEAETGYFSSLVDYNLAIMTLHYRKGSLLEYNNVCLSEGEWPGKAYFDAKRRARERAAGHYFNYGATLPGVVSRGTYRQYQHHYDSMSYDTLPTTLYNENNDSPDGGLRMIETTPTAVIPTPVLPRPGNNETVSFVTPEIVSPAPTSTLTPSRNMRYVR